MTNSLRSIGITPPRDIRTLLIRYHALQADYVRWQIFEIIQRVAVGEDRCVYAN
jgi:hypothetical protein